MTPEYWNLSLNDFELIESIPVCGCGMPNQVYGLYHRVLASTPSSGEEDWPNWSDRLAATEGDERLYYVIAYVLDHLGATEHGGGVGGAWLTDKGERLLLLFDAWSEWGYEPNPCYDARGPDGPEPVWDPSPPGDK